MFDCFVRLRSFKSYVARQTICSTFSRLMSAEMVSRATRLPCMSEISAIFIVSSCPTVPLSTFEDDQFTGRRHARNQRVETMKVVGRLGFESTILLDVSRPFVISLSLP